MSSIETQRRKNGHFPRDALFQVTSSGKHEIAQLVQQCLIQADYILQPPGVNPRFYHDRLELVIWTGMIY